MYKALEAAYVHMAGTAKVLADATAKKFPEIAGWFIAGSEDPDFAAGQRVLFKAAQGAGMDVQYWEAPGVGHDWNMGAVGLAHTVQWLGQRLGITG